MSRSPFHGWRNQNRSLVYLVFLAGMWGLLVVHLSEEWWNNPQYGYGLLIPFLCGWFLWENRAELAGAIQSDRAPFKSSRWAPLFLGCGVALLFPIELLRQVSPQLRFIGIVGVALCLSITYWTLRCLGMRQIPAVAKGVVLLFLTSVPWPTAIEQWVTQSLMKGIASLTAELLNLIGILAFSRGNLIELNQGMVSIDEACSGVRSLQSCIMSTVALSLFFRLSLLRVLVLGFFGLLLALLGNLARTMILTVLAAKRGTASIEAFHDPAGWGILMGVTLVLYFVAARMKAVPRKEAPIKFPDIHWERLPRAGWLVTFGAAALVSAHLWYRSGGELVSAEREPLLQVKNSSEFKLETVPVPSNIWGVLKPSQGAYYHSSSSPYGEISIYTFYWLPGSLKLQSHFHRPDICMTGVGWEMAGTIEQMRVNLDGKETVWYVFSFQREGQRVIQAWGVWRGGVEQNLSFSSDWSAPFGQLWHYKNLIQQGRRKSDTQIASVVIDARLGDREALKQIIRQVFTVRKGNPS